MNKCVLSCLHQAHQPLFTIDLCHVVLLWPCVILIWMMTGNLILMLRNIKKSHAKH